MSFKDWLFSGVWASALLAALAFMVVGPHTLMAMDVQHVMDLASANPGNVAAMVLLSLFGGIALHGRFTAHLTKKADAPKE
ncbi:hypothetical protein HY413_02255 [Candidatus Kaiserbacteria bacterium]|nr:hypothetical protein [Candidatus Kaiserbacteria bacterium]